MMFVDQWFSIVEVRPTMAETGFYAEGVTFQSPGSRLAAHPGSIGQKNNYPEGVAQRIGATPSG